MKGTGTGTGTSRPTGTSTKVKSQGRGRSNSLPTNVVEYLKDWINDHLTHPYPSDQEKTQMVTDTGIELKRLNNWFVNNRIRYWKPRMEALQRQQQQQQQQRSSSSTAVLSAPITPEDPYTHMLSYQAPATTIEDDTSSTATTSTRSTTSTLADAATATATAEPKTTASAWLNNNVAKIVPQAQEHQQTLPPSSPAQSISMISLASSSLCQASDDGSLSDESSVRSEQEQEEEELVYPRMRKRTTTSRSSSSSSLTLTTTEEFPVSPRIKFRKKNEALWRTECVSSPQVYGNGALPTLDEAALLFGFVSAH